LTADVLQLYGIDLGDVDLLRARPWSWLLALIDGCMTARSRLHWERLGPQARKHVRDAMAQGAQVAPWL